MGLAPLQRTVPGTTLTTATDGFSSRLASRSVRPLVQPLTHGVMHDAPTGRLDGVARPSAAAPQVDPPAQPDLPLAGHRVVAQRATAMRRPPLTAAPATAVPGRRLRAAPPVQRQAAGPEAVTPAVQSPAATQALAGTGTEAAEAPFQVDDGAVAAPDDGAEPGAVAAGTPAPGQHTDLALAADPSALPGAPGGTPLDAPSVGSPMTGPRGSAYGPPSPGTPAAGRAPVQRATLADSPRPPRRSGLGAPMVSPVQRAAVQRSRTAAPGGGPGAPAQPVPGLPLRESSTTAGVPSTTPADPAESGGSDGGGSDSGGVPPKVTGAAPDATGPDVPTIGGRTPPATLDVQRSTNGDDDDPASSAVMTPTAPRPDGAPAVLPLQRSHTIADAQAHNSQTGTTRTAPAVPGDATAPAGADTPPQEVGADVAVASPHLPPPLVPRQAAGMGSMPLLAQRAPLLQRMPAAGTEGEVDTASGPSANAAGPPTGGVTPATQMSATVPSPRGGPGSGPRGTQPGRTVQPLRRAGHGAVASGQPPSRPVTAAQPGSRPVAPVQPPSRPVTAAQPPSRPVTPVQPGSQATSGTAGSPGVSAAWASLGAPAHAGYDASTAIPGDAALVAEPAGTADGDTFVQTLAPSSSPAARGPVASAVAAGVQRLVARAARGTGTQAPASRGEGAAMTFPARDRSGGPGGTAVALSHAVAGPDAAPPVVQRAPEPAEVAETPPSAAAPVAAVPAGATAAAGGMPRSEEDLDVLAGRLYDHIAGRLRRELRVDRERTGLLTDLQG